MKLTGSERIKRNQRILGDSDFESDVLSESEKSFSGNINLKVLVMIMKRLLKGAQFNYRLKKRLYNQKGVAKLRVQSTLVCYWIVVDLVTSIFDFVKKLDMPVAISYLVQQGEKMAKEQGYQLET
jgi:hypothetical protein